MKKYIKELDLFFEAVNGIIETISDKLGEYAVKNIIIKSADVVNTQKGDVYELG
ncbi:MAG: hypothetical protein GXO62_01830 [Epsilonproteobacteria bacterium]|nr:hypothetical protein [Campylobacterota bacterium]